MIETGSSALTDYQKERLASFSKEKRVDNSIIFTGDSIVEFFPLKKYLGRDYPLLNRGIAGTDTIWLLEHLEEQILSYQPEKLFISIGVNDIGRGYAISDIVNRMAELLGQVQMFLPQTDIFLLSIFPVNEKESYQDKVKIRNNKTIQELNQRLESLPAVTFIDLYNLLLNTEGQLAENYTIDGLHLSQEAYGKLAEYLREYL